MCVNLLTSPSSRRARPTVDYVAGNGPCAAVRYRGGMTTAVEPVGRLIREWRQRRHLSQLDLACDAEISTRHLSFIETGRSSPSRDMVLRLAERLEVPLRSRNSLLTAAGFAPMFPERPLADPALQPARTAIDHLLAAHEPFPALAVDRHWTLVASNGRVAPADGRGRSVVAHARCQRAPDQPAPAGIGVAHRQFRRVACARAVAAAPPGGGLGGSDPARAGGRARSLPDAADGIG